MSDNKQRNRKRVLSVFLTAMLTGALTLSGCGQRAPADKAASQPTGGAAAPAAKTTPAPTSGSQIINIGAAAPGGSFFALAGGISKILNEKLGMKSSVTSTGGSAANVKLVNTKEMDIGFSQASTIYEGYNGTETWTGNKKFENIRLIMYLNPTYLHGITDASSSVKGLSDFADKRVSLGAPGGSHEVIGRQVLGALGITPKEIARSPLNEVKDLLMDNRIEAILLPTAYPNTDFMEIEASRSARVFGVTKDEAAKVIAKYPFFTVGQVPAGVYKGNGGAAVDALKISNVLIANKDVSEQLIYDVLATIFANNPMMVAAHPSAKEINIKDNSESPIPMHRGAVKYFREKGINVDKAVPPEMK